MRVYMYISIHIYEKMRKKSNQNVDGDHFWAVGLQRIFISYSVIEKSLGLKSAHTV